MRPPPLGYYLAFFCYCATFATIAGVVITTTSQSPHNHEDEEMGQARNFDHHQTLANPINKSRTLRTAIERKFNNASNNSHLNSGESRTESLQHNVPTTNNGWRNNISRTMKNGPENSHYFSVINGQFNQVSDGDDESNIGSKVAKSEDNNDGGDRKSARGQPEKVLLGRHSHQRHQRVAQEKEDLDTSSDGGDNGARINYGSESSSLSGQISDFGVKTQMTSNEPKNQSISRLDSIQEVEEEQREQEGNSIHDSPTLIDYDSFLLEQLLNKPMSFGTNNLTTVTTQVGATAHLSCIVHFIGGSVVSWIRKKDYHLLTVALATYSSDERFSAIHLKNSEDWTLQIRYVQARDAGMYECQVSTHPPTSILINLNVVEARAEILGPSVKYLQPDSTIRLICHVRQNTEPSLFLFWYHFNKMINYDIEKGFNIQTNSEFNYSELIIYNAKPSHSGNYSCEPSNALRASVVVQVFEGDNPAAMQSASSPIRAVGGRGQLSVLPIICLILIQLHS